MFFTINKNTAINSNNITCIEYTNGVAIIYFGSSQNITANMDKETYDKMIEMLKEGG